MKGDAQAKSEEQRWMDAMRVLRRRQPKVAEAMLDMVEVAAATARKPSLDESIDEIYTDA
jgi:hypothetical protein